MVQALARELAGRGVHDQRRRPGFIETDMTAGMPFVSARPAGG